YLLIISTYLEMWVITGSFVILAVLNYDKLGPAVANIFLLAIVLYFIVFLTAFLLLIKRSFVIKAESKSLKAERDQFIKGYITVRSNRKRAKILYEDICYIESRGDYIEIIIEADSSIMTHERIGHIIKALP